jgi:CheY-like chemotaxis protein
MHRRRVIVIDDEDRVVRQLHDWLTSLGYQVRGFGNAGAALEALRREPADVVIASARVPDITSRDLCTEIRRASGAGDVGAAPRIVGHLCADQRSSPSDGWDAVVPRGCPHDVLLAALAGASPAFVPRS